ncbi:NAD(P)H-hydrate dehydratase [Candidatus Peregrinibacteria bacterium]|nr:NAD(P)H-hydrate dehydratase [Candidatus Peregrinibacteria bacterium]
MKFPVRNLDAHKGDHGKILIIGGSEVFHGAPILAALGAEKSGVDLVSLFVPEAQAMVTKMASFNFIVHSFGKPHLTLSNVQSILERAKTADVLVLGNGLGKHPETHAAILDILTNVNIPAVIDADALIPEILTIKKKSEWILTPHEGEFQRLFGKNSTPKIVQEMAKKYTYTILKKGRVDIIANKNGEVVENKTGVPEMSVGGTGDVLAGIVAGFFAQGLSSLNSSELGAFLWGKCGEELAQTHLSFSAIDMLSVFPKVAKKFFGVS